MVFIIPASSRDLDYCHFRLNMGHSQETLTGVSYCKLNFFLTETYHKNNSNKALKVYHEYLKFEDIFTVIIVESPQIFSLWIEDNRLQKIRGLDNIEIRNFLNNLLKKTSGNKPSQIIKTRAKFIQNTN